MTDDTDADDEEPDSSDPEIDGADAPVDSEDEAPSSTGRTGSADDDPDLDHAPDSPVDQPSDGEAPPGDHATLDRADRDIPLSDLAARYSGETPDGSEAGQAAHPNADEVFEREDPAQVDREALWRQVADEETAQQAIAEIDDDGLGVRPPEEGGEELVDVGDRVVDKSKYCHDCPHFSAPPDVHCTHEGTEILEAVDMEHFRVRNCPIVRENEELEEF